MDINTQTLITAGVTFVAGGGIVKMYPYVMQFMKAKWRTEVEIKKIEIEQQRTDMDNFRTIIDSMQTEIARLNAKVNRLEKEVEDCELRYATLRVDHEELKDRIRPVLSNPSKSKFTVLD